MAIIIEEEKKKINWFAVAVVAVIVAVMAAAVYYLFFVNPGSIKIVLPDSLKSLQEASRLKSDLEKIKSIKHPLLQSLRVYVESPAAEPTYNSNPFR